jgi:hypothetical protein
MELCSPFDSPPTSSKKVDLSVAYIPWSESFDLGAGGFLRAAYQWYFLATSFFLLGFVRLSDFFEWLDRLLACRGEKDPNIAKLLVYIDLLQR